MYEITGNTTSLGLISLAHGATLSLLDHFYCTVAVNQKLASLITRCLNGWHVFVAPNETAKTYQRGIDVTCRSQKECSIVAKLVLNSMFSGQRYSTELALLLVWKEVGSIPISPYGSLDTLSVTALPVSI